MKINGNKLNLGIIISFLPSFVSAIGKIFSAHGDFQTIVTAVGEGVAIIGAAHKVIKGQNDPAPPADNGK